MPCYRFAWASLLLLMPPLALADDIEKKGAHDKAPQAQAPLKVRLRITDPGINFGPGSEVDLENASHEVLRITYRSTILEHLRLTITNDKGVVVVDWKHCNRFSSNLGLTDSVRELKPAEVLRCGFGVAGALDLAKQKPGRYYAKVAFNYKGRVIEAEEVEFEYKNKDYGKE
jgi:hypothetical protein